MITEQIKLVNQDNIVSNIGQTGYALVLDSAMFDPIRRIAVGMLCEVMFTMYLYFKRLFYFDPSQSGVNVFKVSQWCFVSQDSLTF